MLTDPGRVLGEGAQERAVQAARGAKVNIFDRSAVAQFGLGEAASQGAVLSPSPLLIDEQGEAFLKAQFPEVRLLGLGVKGFGHALEAQGVQFI
jgi:hypothetical protein